MAPPRASQVKRQKPPRISHLAPSPPPIQCSPCLNRGHWSLALPLAFEAPAGDTAEGRQGGETALGLDQRRGSSWR